jgi:hypothetical protein
MANILDVGNKSSYISKRYIRVMEVASEYQISEEDIRLIAIEAGALYKLPRTELIHKERLDDYMKHLYKVPGTNKQVVKKFVRIGEGSIIYSIGHHRFIEMARAAGATYKINEGTGGTVLINLEVFDEYMEQFRQNAVPMHHPLFATKKEGE